MKPPRHLSKVTVLGPLGVPMTWSQYVKAKCRINRSDVNRFFLAENWHCCKCNQQMTDYYKVRGFYAPCRLCKRISAYCSVHDFCMPFVLRDNPVSQIIRYFSSKSPVIVDTCDQCRHDGLA